MRPKILSLITSPLLATTVLFIIYILLAFLLPPGGYFSGDQGVKYVQINAIARSHTLSVGTVNEELSIFRPAFDSFYHQVGNNYQAIFSPAYAVVVLPFYLLMGMRGLVIPAIFGALLAAYASGLLGKALGARYSGAIVLVVGLASPLVFYAFILWEHTLSVGLVVMATYLALKERSIGAGVLAALAVWFRPETMLFGLAVVLSVLVAFGIRAGISFMLRFSSGFLTSITPWWVYNFLSFGTLLGPQVAANPVTIESRLSVITLHFLPLGQRKWALLLILVLILLMILHFLRRSRVPALLLLLFGVVGINLVHLGLYLNGAAPSVTDVFPFAFVSLVSLIWLSKDARIRLIWVLTGSYLFGVTFTSPTAGGSGWGPRMLLGVFPLLAILSWNGFEISRGRLLKFAALTLLASSLIIQLAGLRHLSITQNQWTQLNTELALLEPNVVATAVWWLPQVGAPTKEQLHWYGVGDDRDVEKLTRVEKCFWWIWTDEPTSDPWELPLHHVSTPPNTNLAQLEVRKLCTRGLEARLYCVTR